MFLAVDLPASFSSMTVALESDVNIVSIVFYLFINLSVPKNLQRYMAYSVMKLFDYLVNNQRLQVRMRLVMCCVTFVFIVLRSFFKFQDKKFVKKANIYNLPMICVREGSPPLPDAYNISLTGLGTMVNFLFKI